MNHFWRDFQTGHFMDLFNICLNYVPPTTSFFVNHINIMMFSDVRILYIFDSIISYSGSIYNNSIFGVHILCATVH